MKLLGKLIIDRILKFNLLRKNKLINYITEIPKSALTTTQLKEFETEVIQIIRNSFMQLNQYKNDKKELLSGKKIKNKIIY